MSDPIPTPPVATPAAEAPPVAEPPIPTPPVAPPPAEAPPAATPPAELPPVAVPDWMKDLTPELQADADLQRIGDIPDLAKAYSDTRRWAKDRIPIPTDEAGFKELGEKLRPETENAYEIPVPEGEDDAFATEFKQFAYDTGLPPQWAKSIAEFSNRYQVERLSKLGQANNDGLKSVELDYGPVGYNTRLDAVSNMFESAGIDGFDIVTGMQTAMSADGSPSAEKTLRGLFTLAEKYGELEKVDASQVGLRMGATTPAAAQQEITRMFNDPVIAPKLRDPNSAESKKYEQLIAVAAKV